VKDSTEPHTQSIPVHHEQLVEVRHLEHGPSGEGTLQRLEGLLSLCVPVECLSPQETRQGWHDEPEVPDELSVVARQA
jgi:hypothetical protein